MGQSYSLPCTTQKDTAREVSKTEFGSVATHCPDSYLALATILLAVCGLWPIRNLPGSCRDRLRSTTAKSNLRMCRTVSTPNSKSFLFRRSRSTERPSKSESLYSVGPIWLLCECMELLRHCQGKPLCCQGLSRSKAAACPLHLVGHSWQISFDKAQITGQFWVRANGA